MNYDRLKELLNIKFGDNWINGKFEKGSTVPNGAVTIQFIDDTPLSADNKIYKQNPRYQLNYFNINIENSVDDFFLDNEIIYTNKSQFFNQEEECYQTNYTFYL